MTYDYPNSDMSTHNKECTVKRTQIDVLVNVPVVSCVNGNCRACTASEIWGREGKFNFLPVTVLTKVASLKLLSAFEGKHQLTPVTSTEASLEIQIASSRGPFFCKKHGRERQV